MTRYATRFILSVSFALCLALPGGVARADAEALNAAYAQYKALRDAGRYAEAAPFAREALAIGEALFQDDERQLGHLLGNVAELEDRLGNVEAAETLYRRALANQERHPEHKPILHATTLSNLAELERTRGRPAAAAPLSEKALAIWRAQVGAGDARLGTALANHAAILLDLDRGQEALPLLREALTIRQTALGRDAPATVEVRDGIATLTGGPGASTSLARARAAQRAVRHAEAERLYRQALAELEASRGQDDPSLSPALRALAEIHMARGAYGEAETLFKRALAIHRQKPEMRPLAHAALVRSYAALLRRTGRRAEAQRLDAEAP